MNSPSYREDKLNRLRDDEYARVYLESALEELAFDGHQDAFLVALRDVAEARGGIGALAEQTHRNRRTLYKALSAKGNPRLDTLDSALRSLGFRLSIEPLSRDR